ncbi:MAG: hypothetical protein U0L05_03405 [Schaedlerella sp.]|nr:hypothetical protein [Schaedlerella sp.]
MHSIIKKLAEIDAAASMIVNNAEQQKLSLDQEYQEKHRIFDEELKSQTHSELEKIRSGLEKESVELLRHQQSASQAYITSLQQEYDENHTQYAQAILKKIIEV